MEWLSTNNIIILSGVLLVVLVILIILLSVNGRKKKKTKNQATKQKQSVKKETAQVYELKTLFPDENLAKIVAQKLGVNQEDKINDEKLSTIKNLDAEASGIIDLKGISHLKNVEAINLNDNKLIELPNEINELTNLKELKVSNNKLNNVDNLKQNATLKNLDISNNEIGHLPQNLQNFTNLEKLLASNNQILSIPTELTSAPKLRELDMSNNMVGAIPSTIGNLPMLSSLNLASNLLTEVPLELGKLEKINKVNLKNNDDLVIPKELNTKLQDKKVEVLKDEVEVASEMPIKEFASIKTELEGVEVIPSESLEGNQGEENMSKTNTYIDLTSSNDDLLSEIKALEKSLEDTMPTLKINEAKISNNTNDDIVKSSQAERVAIMPESNDFKHNAEVEKRKFMENEKITRVGNDMNENTELEVVQEVETKKEKRKKILKIAGIVAGATVAVATAAGTAFYFYQKNENKKIEKKKVGFPFLNKGE